MHGPLAQSVEQKTFNLLVDGSNPSRPTNAAMTKAPHGRLFHALCAVVDRNGVHLLDTQGLPPQA